MNFHTNEWIMSKMWEHYNDALTYFPEDRIVGIYYQGSANYGLDYEGSDVDTKLIVTPTFEDIAMNRKAVSTTHVRENNEHIDFKDIRLYVETFRKQNLNFLEILFTPFQIVNPLYAGEWERLISNRESIARMNVHRAVKSMKGIAMEKYHAMEHRYPAKVDIIDKYGYDGKQVSHLDRVDDYLERYISGVAYKDCLIPRSSRRQRMWDYKMLDRISLEQARIEAKEILDHVVEMADEFCARIPDQECEVMRDLLEDVSYQIMKISVEKELSK
jgi:hypothetical protein